MAQYLILLTITFSAFALAALLINYCKRRVCGTNHGLTGMCHKSGGSMCCSCAAKLTAPASAKPVSENGRVADDFVGA